MSTHPRGDDAGMASAALDRLLHKSTVINIHGGTYRMNENRRASESAPKEGDRPS